MTKVSIEERANNGQTIHKSIEIKKVFLSR